MVDETVDLMEYKLVDQLVGSLVVCLGDMFVDNVLVLLEKKLVAQKVELKVEYLVE